MTITAKETMMKLLLLSIFVFSIETRAANLEDVSILEIRPGQENIKLKLHTKDGPQNSYFIVDIGKSDPEAFEKLVKTIKKVKQKDQYQLNLSIPSFSISPSGSYYKSEGINFELRGDREPDSIKSKKKK